jgi:hypothetical protein
MIGASRRTYKNLVDEVLSWAGMGTDTANLRQLAKYAVAASHASRLTDSRWTFMLYPTPQQLSIVAGQQNYALHEAFLTPQYFRSISSSNARPIKPVPYAKVASYLPDYTTDTGATTYVTVHGVTKVQNQPTSASVITPSSSNPADNGKLVTVVGETATGLQSEVLTLPNAGSIAFTAILDVTKGDGTWQGTLSLKSNAGAVTLLTLSPTQYGRQFRQMRALLPPSASETWEYNFFRQPKQLVADNDIPDTPFPFDYIHVLDALIAMADHTRPTGSILSEWNRQRDALEQNLESTYQDGLAQDSESDGITLIDRG